MQKCATALRLLTLSSTLATLWAVECRPIREIYASGKELCEVMWNQAFKYEVDEENAYSMWFFDMNNNPNDDTSAHLGHHTQGASPDQCYVQSLHKAAPGPEGEGFTECHPWKQHACCRGSVVESYIHLKEAYGEGFYWDRCGPLSQECERFFVQEACFYECEPNVGYYKKYPDGMDEGGFENHWQMHNMPIKASYCDSWYAACADDLFCGTGDFFQCAREYQALDEAPEDSSMAGGVIAIIVAGAVLLAVSCAILAFFILRERAGRPVFTPLNEKRGAPPGAGGKPIGNSLA
mmetsp:Transcript_46846/g.85830  ORF Transcript_46846/g.85830 Transcript_46846/m.85830 type:complete len:293 (-) Transcript_46846:30-908(-)